MEFQLVTTDHLVDRLWFQDDDDFKVGMNGVAVIAHLLSMDVLSFILMSNHVHFVLCGTHDEAELFINEYKRHHSAYLQRKYGFKEYLRRNDVDIQRVGVEDESLERAIAYVQMNSVAANICLHPTGYAWGTGNAFFTLTPAHGRRIGSMSRRSQIKCLKSNIVLPEYLRVSDGFVLPESFVQVRFVEDIYRTPARFNYFLVNSSKAKKRMETNPDIPSFKDQVILSAIPDLCRSLYRQLSLNELSSDQRGEVVRQLRRRFSADIHQLVRVTGIAYPEMARMLDSI
jgi:hypothetical protein